MGIQDSANRIKNNVAAAYAAAAEKGASIPETANSDNLPGTIRSIHETVSADNVFFEDGETFQKKYDDGELRGPVGPAGYTPQKGVDYWTEADQAEIAEQAAAALTNAVKLTALPASGTTLTANAEYRVAATVGTYQFNFPASGDVYVRFTTAGTFAISFADGTKYLGSYPKFKANATYEMLARDGVVAVAEVIAGVGFVSYIETTGTQYFNVGFKPNQNTRIVIDFELIAYGASNAAFIYGIRSDTSVNAYHMTLEPNINSYTIAYGNGYKNVALNDVRRFSVDHNKSTVTVNGVTTALTYYTFQTLYNMYLLALNEAGHLNSVMSSIRLYSCKIYDNDNLIRDYRPYVDDEGVACLWDAVNGECVYHEGTGELLHGEVTA